MITALAWCFETTASAILFYDTGDPNHNTTAPTGLYQDSGWQYEGRYGSFLGTMIAPQYFITAQHFGLQGGTFVHSGVFNGGSDVVYTIDFAANGGLGYWDIAGTDLRIIKINEAFPYYAQLYTGSSETGSTLVTHGLGGPRGDEVIVSLESKGWKSTGADGIARWGANVVTGIAAGSVGDLIMADFNALGGQEEAYLSPGDSGGGLFIQDAGIWKLAGINYSVDGYFDTNGNTGDGSEFLGGIYDLGGLWEGSDGIGWSFHADEVDDLPVTFYASRISSSASAIQSIAVVPEPSAFSLLVYLMGGWVMRRKRPGLRCL